MQHVTLAPAVSLRRQQMAILMSLIVLTVAAWTVLIWQASRMNTGMATSPTMGMGAALWLTLWVAMMVAVMFPSAAPMILIYARIAQGKRERGQVFVPAWVFVSAYLFIWTLMGVVAYAAAAGIEHLAAQSMWLMENGRRLGGVVLLIAGLYQFSPLKHLCLTKCRTPLTFILTSWRNGYGGAFRMGLEHAVYCLGCCWFLFVILFPLGMLNIAVLSLLTLVIFVEKVLPNGRRASYGAAVFLVLYGALVIFVPDLLPLSPHSSDHM
jgi:predicted metal-binding membrane protein